MFPGVQAAAMARVAHGASGYAAGDTGADAFVADILAAADSQLVALYLAHDSATYRTIGTGVSALLDQVASANVTQAVGSQQPTISATGGPNSRGRITFASAASQALVAASAFSHTSGDRWGMFSVVQPSASGATNQRHMAFGDTTNAVLILQRTTADGWNSFLNPTVIALAADDNTNPHVHEGYMANPHTSVFDSSASTDANTGGYAVTFTANLVLGANRLATNTYYDGHLMLAGLVKLSGTAVPSWMPTVRGYIDTYYGL